MPLRLLIVEDSEDDMELLLSEVRRGGYEVTHERVDTAPAMGRALDTQAWDLIITDHAMPSFSSSAALAMVKERGLDLPFIIVSGTIGEEVAVRAMKEGAHDYIIKGNLARLNPAIARELREASLRRAKKKVDEDLEKTLEELRSVSTLARLRAAELQAVLDTMIESVFVCDSRGEIVLINRAGLKLLGWSRADGLKFNLSELSALLRIRHMDGRAVAGEEQPLSRVLRGENIVETNEIMFAPGINRDIYVRSSVAPIMDEWGKPAGGVQVCRDLTDLIEFNRLKDQFIRVAAHELKTPVTIIKGYAQALPRMVAGIPDSGRKMLDAINSGADRIDKSIRDLLDISQLHLGRMPLTAEKLDLPALVREAIEKEQRKTVKHKITLVESQPVLVVADKDRLIQALMALLGNAVKFSPAGGSVDVKISATDRDAVVSVKDAGIGIPKDRQAGIFEKFYRAHTDTPSDYGGMGVGLYIAKQIIAHHGGKIWFESEEGKGSVFSFSIPSRGRYAA